MIISASRRTDIPAWYTEWLMGRLRAGFCEVTNPRNPGQVTRVELTPDRVDALVFWTRNAAPLLPYLPELEARGYRYYFQYTLTGYARSFEPGVPSAAEAINTIRQLAAHLGPRRVIWRYDPILFTTATPPAYHAERFSELAANLAGATCRVVISLADEYRAAAARLARLASSGMLPLEVPVDSGSFAVLMRALTGVAAHHGMEIQSCAEDIDLRPFGIMPGKCIDAELLRQLFGCEVNVGKDPSQRRACGCVLSKDIGVYDTCPHGCVYCYATRSATRAARNYAAHRADSTALCCRPMEDGADAGQA